MSAVPFCFLASRKRQLGGEAVARFEARARKEGLATWQLAPHCMVAAGAEASTLGRQALMIGRCSRGADVLAPGERALLAALPFTELVTSCWGDYVLVRATAGGDLELLHAPFGNVPCLWSADDDQVLVASSVSLLQRFGLPRPRADWCEVGRFLLATELRHEATCLSGICELAGGSALRVSAEGVTSDQVWSPWRFAARHAQVATFEEGTGLVRAASEAAVSRVGGAGNPVVLMLSGGIDSSLVAAALASQARRAACVTMVSENRLGDERGYARAVAAALGFPLSEHWRALEQVDLTRSGASEMPRPSASVFRQPSERAGRECARSVGAPVVLDGGGGDNLFCSLQSVTPILDRVRCEGPGKGVLATARDIAVLAQTGLPAVLWATAKRMASRRNRYRWTIDVSFLTPQSSALAAGVADHPWLDPPPDALPGKAAHVALVLAAANLAGQGQDEEGPLFLAPLVSQPVVEAVLRIPSWMWFRDGRSSAVARAAWADRLPSAVTRRSSKGTPAGFMATLVEQRREEIRSILLDGLLVSHGIVDRDLLDRALSGDAIARDFGFARIIQLLDVEIWARSWS